MSSTIQVRVDDDLKIKSDNLFKELGTDTTTVIRMFLTQAAASLLDAYEFAKGKPIQLINGAELLGSLEKHGHKAKIDLKEAKLINKGNNNLI